MTALGVLARWWAWQIGRARSARGVIATICTGVLVLGAASSNAAPAVAFLVLVGLAPALWWIAWAALGLFAPMWRRLVAGKPPAVKVGRAWQPSVGSRKQLREDANARFFADRGGILVRQRRWFIASGTPPVPVPSEAFARAAAEQLSNPVYVTSYRDRTYWWYQDAIYWTNGDYGPRDVKALLYARERRQQRELEHAHALMAAAGAPVERKRD